ncbi:MAG TPA: sulfotransferase [Thermomicrobiales bacterium]|nr:sulfotransferase [Thermomicrobiales bacterium]
MIYVVLGMHKSGTSLVSETLHHSGISMVEPEDIEGASGYDDGNKHERHEVFDINNEILGSHGVESIDILPPRALRVTPALRRRMTDLVGRLSSSYADWGFKDPRLCFTYPVWEQVLPEHRVIGVYRPLHELAFRYRADRSLRRAFRLVRAWRDNNERMIEHLAKLERPWILVHYGRLMEGDTELRRIEAFVGRPVVDRRKPALRRGTATPNWRMRVAERLHRIRTGWSAATCIARLDELAGHGGAHSDSRPASVAGAK